MTLCCIIEISNKHISVEERQLSWRVEKINLISNKACPFKTWTQHKYNMAAMEKHLSDLLSQMVADKARSFLGTRLFPLAILIYYYYFFHTLSVYIYECTGETLDYTNVFWQGLPSDVNLAVLSTRQGSSLRSSIDEIRVLLGNCLCWDSSHPTWNISGVVVWIIGSHPKLPV